MCIQMLTSRWRPIIHGAWLLQDARSSTGAMSNSGHLQDASCAETESTVAPSVPSGGGLTAVLPATAGQPPDFSASSSRFDAVPFHVHGHSRDHQDRRWKVIPAVESTLARPIPSQRALPRHKAIAPPPSVINGRRLKCDGADGTASSTALLAMLKSWLQDELHGKVFQEALFRLRRRNVAWRHDRTSA